MKIRSDFVSNSSSSSFIVINNSGKYETVDFQDGVVYFPSEEGEREFGWQTEIYSDIWSKLNWCALVALSKYEKEKTLKNSDIIREDIEKPWFKFDEMRKNFSKVCERIGIRGEIDVDAYDKADSFSCDFGYIDHQSNIGENPENARMFESEETLYDFVSNSDSYIDNSNDNGGRDDSPDGYERPADYSKRK